ncbi:MAG: hypothetical protein WBQ16_05480 [Nitrososphaeraceae archaeon]
MKSVISLLFIGFLFIGVIPTESLAIAIHRPDMRMAAIGDMGCSPVTSKLIQEINNKMPRIILALGDLSYQKYNADCWLNIVSPVER